MMTPRLLAAAKLWGQPVRRRFPSLVLCSFWVLGCWVLPALPRRSCSSVDDPPAGVNAKYRPDRDGVKSRTTIPSPNVFCLLGASKCKGDIESGSGQLDLLSRACLRVSSPVAPAPSPFMPATYE